MQLTRARTQAQSANAAANSLHSENSGLRELIGQKDMQIAHLQNQLANIQVRVFSGSLNSTQCIRSTHSACRQHQ